MALGLTTTTSITKKTSVAFFIKEGKPQFGVKSKELSSLTQKGLDQLVKLEARGSSTATFLGEDFPNAVAQIKAIPGLDKSEEIRMAAYNLGLELKKQGLIKTVILVSDISSSNFISVVEGLLFAQYSFDTHKSAKSKALPIQWKVAISESAKKELTAVFKSTSKIIAGVETTRDLVNEPGGSLTPQIFVKRIQQTFKGDSRITLKVRNKAQLEKESFNGLLTVGRGGINPPVMVTINYKPKKVSPAAKGTKLGLVGKGVTFDTGGISLKPPGTMWEMRMDMGGAGTVIGAMQAIADLDLPIPVVAVVCLTENRPGVDAVLPGDIFTAKNGKTIQVENTDAEGRLILTDGLAEAGLQKATHIIDLATLTGAIIRAIGMSITGLFSNNEELADKITQAGAKSGEKFWRLPLDMEYRASLDDKVADMKNIGGDAGSITAGLFLQEFVPENTPWAHLDIAGTAFTTKPWKYYNWGATGWGVRSLVNLTEELASDKKSKNT